tara:strand:+ start:1893 stop:2606 length:714 start_codon:yes stop_codon:yes gene_type:complete
MNSFDIEHYRREGWAPSERVFGADECDNFIEYMLGLQDGKILLEGFEKRGSEEWQRTHNQHHYDLKAKNWLIAPPLHSLLSQCLNDEPEGIQTMYFWKGSEQRRHQDQFYLPGCLSAWIALMDVDENNGTIWVQSKSHKGRLLTTADFDEGGEFFEWDYNTAVDELFRRNDLPEIPVRVRKGDVVFFDGKLVHRGGPVANKESFRHVIANHYIGQGFKDWPHTGWSRLSFDGSERFI